jgi:hypothetical protein
MAAIITGAIGELGALLSAGGIGGALARGGLTGLGAIGASQLITAIEKDLGAGGQPAAQARRAPKYAIVDLHGNNVVRFLSTRKVYSILTHPSRRGQRGRACTRIVTVPRGSEVEVR